MSYGRVIIADSRGIHRQRAVIIADRAATRAINSVLVPDCRSAVS